MRQGAIYWAKSMISGGTIHDSATGNVIKSDDNGVGLDINFFTYDVNYISENNVYKKDNANAKSDACFVRMKAKTDLQSAPKANEPRCSPATHGVHWLRSAFIESI